MPDALVCTPRAALVPLFVTVTVTPGMTAPDESFTAPVMVPSVCATPGAQSSSQTNPVSRPRYMTISF